MLDNRAAHEQEPFRSAAPLVHGRRAALHALPDAVLASPDAVASAAALSPRGIAA
jgi:hypothetical protein